MLKRIENLPNWCLVNKNPSFYDTESKTVLEETVKIYGKIQELISDYNLFVNEVNKKIDEFTTSTDKDQECFKQTITKLIEDYIVSIDTKISKQDLEIKEAVNFMKENISESLVELINEMKESGELNDVILNALEEVNTRLTALENKTVNLEYNEEIESLNLVGDTPDEVVSQLLEGEY